MAAWKKESGEFYMDNGKKKERIVVLKQSRKEFKNRIIGNVGIRKPAKIQSFGFGK